MRYAGQILIFTFKDGILSKLGHDLRLAVHDFSIKTDNSRVEAAFSPDSISVDGAMLNGKFSSHELSAKDRSEIEATMKKKVLDVTKHPRISFSGAARDHGDKVNLVGALELHGSAREVDIELTRVGETLEGTVELTPSLWGITPYKALLGALKLQDRVRIAISVQPESSNGEPTPTS